MGSSTFTDLHVDTRSAQTLYEDLRQQSLYDDGHDPYSGSLGTTEGVRVAVDGLHSIEDAHRIANDRITGLRKWGECEAIAVHAPAQHTYDAAYKVAVDVTLAGDAEHGATANAVRAAIAKQVGVHVDEVHDTGWLRPRRQPKVQVRSSVGDRVTRYFIVGDGRLSLSDTSYATQAEARAALKSGVGFAHRSQASIVAVTTREDGQGLVTGTVTSASWRYVGEVTIRPIVKRGRANPSKHYGWLLYGVVAH